MISKVSKILKELSFFEMVQYVLLESFSWSPDTGGNDAI